MTAELLPDLSFEHFLEIGVSVGDALRIMKALRGQRESRPPTPVKGQGNGSAAQPPLGNLIVTHPVGAPAASLATHSEPTPHRLSSLEEVSHPSKEESTLRTHSEPIPHNRLSSLEASTEV